MADEGELIADRYRLVSHVGRGSMGIVWQARDERLDRVVAVKQLVADGGTAVRQALREGRLAARLKHPHAIAVHDVVEHGGKPWLVLEFLPSRSLSAILAERGTLPPEAVATIGGQVASALAAAHAEGIVHRDVKPGNVLIAADGTAKIADFGIARALGEGTATGAGMIAGTPAFLAPEVAAGEDAGFAADVFSLGATLYTALEGAPPFGTDDNPLALVRKVAQGRIDPPRRSGPLTGILLRVLRAGPAERPSMAEFHEALQAIAAGRTLPPPRDPTLLLPRRREFPRRTVLAGAGAACLVAAGVLIGTTLGRDGGDAAATTPPPTATTLRAVPRCQAEYRITNAWPGAHQAEVTVRNTDQRAITGWTVTWTLTGGQQVGNLWNGSLNQQGTSVTVSNADWNAIVKPGGSTTFGLITSGDPVQPRLTCTSP
ncbi:protein kinase [Amycolatopsis sp. K13G38]|uniref:non-specific serine/threonine protein kinase n=1 Tax=Amycolatopsis acididurans TaxID=2724524 RepID=A0ABX1J8G6_9PSEU|nr:protein kinase [Amycolatopsis acididurans]NKQ54592.1 protein kinase [Amycolatopsis acididurans]